MNLKHFLLFLLAINSLSLIAQTPMVAYRKEGIWHYFDTQGKPLWEPFMDVARFPAGWVNGLLCASTMDVKGNDTTTIGFENKQVLYDATGKIVFMPKINKPYRIISGIDKAGFVELADLDTEQLILCDKAGNVQYKSTKTHCQYFGDGVVAYLKTIEESEIDGDRNYVLFDVKTKKVIAEIKCYGLLGNYADGAIFCYNRDFKWGMLNRTGKPTQPMIWDCNLLEYEGSFPLEKGFITLENPKTNRLSLLNKNGEVVVSDISEVGFHNQHFFSCQKLVADEQVYFDYILDGTKATEIDKKYGEIETGTEGGIFIAGDEKGNLTFMDKNFNSITKMKEGKESMIEFFQHHIWITTDDENAYTCFNEKGVKTGAIKANNLGKPAFSHVFFKQNGLWGLAHESGKIIIKPTFEFESSDVPDIQNGYFTHVVKLPNDKTRFDFYDFEGKLVLSSTSEKDGWDFISSQQSYPLNYRPY
jgi:hypothetical protein